jgi:phosphoglycerol transferase
MQRNRIKKIIVLLLKPVAIVACLFFIAEHYFFEITPFSVSPTFILAILGLIAINWKTKEFQKKDYFKPSHIPPHSYSALLCSPF